MIADSSRFDKFLNRLNEAQRDAVTAPEGPALVLAGAGTGKTRVLTGRAFFLIECEQVNPASLAIMTFTNKAAGELKERLSAFVGSENKVPWAGTFHGFCVRLLRQWYREVGLEKGFTIYDDDDSDKLISELLSNRHVRREELRPSAMRNWISVLKSGGKLSGRDRYHYLADDLTIEYDRRLRAANAVDFDDLILLPIELFANHPDVLEVFRRKYDHVLIDEFQDTNAAQYKLARLIAYPQNSIFAVGDDDQSIYSWRGADFRNVLNFEQEFPGARIFRLEQNYRSTQAILDVANDIISVKISGRKGKRLWTAEEGGVKAAMSRHTRAADEANEIVGQMDSMVRKGDFSWRDIAVLYRTNSLSRYFEEVLIQRAIPYTIVGGTKFYNRREVRDLIAHLRIVVNPNDEQAWSRAFRTPPKGIGDVSIRNFFDNNLSRRITGTLDPDVMGMSGLPLQLIKKVSAFSEKVSEWRSVVAENSIVDSVRKILDESGLIEYYAEREDESSEDRVANLLQFVAAVQERQQMHPEYDLSDLLGEIALVSDVDDYENRAERVTLMTMHAAKGLEFPVVFVVCLEESLIPHQRSMGSQHQIDEERRLLYVAVTRARQRLFLSHSETRAINGRVEFQEPSRFLKDILPDHVQGWTLPAAPSSRYEYVENEDYGYREIARREQRPRSFQANPNRGMSLVPYKIGDIVEHEEFGVGVVTAKSGDADSLKIRVAFQGIGSKLLAVKYALLKKVG